MLHFTIITLFPDMFPGVLGYSLTGHALENSLWSYDTINLRDFGIGKHNRVDDTPYGGGAGMVLRPDVVDAALQSALKKHPDAHIIHFTPRGEALTQKLVAEVANHRFCEEAPADDAVHKNRPLDRRASPEGSLAKAQYTTTHIPHTPSRNHILLCGRFEAIDERIFNTYQIREISLGDFVMTGGELAAMALMDATIRLLPGVIGEANSLKEESFGLSEDYACLLEYPHYTAPPDWEGNKVPEVLLSGHHSKISDWRKSQAEMLTRARRPDLWKRYNAEKTKG